MNGKTIKKPIIINGYAVIDRKWKPGDRVELELPLKPHAVMGHPEIEAAKGKFALMRGPVVYCMEETDNPDYFNETEDFQVHFDEITGEFDQDLLGGVVALKSKDTRRSQRNYLNYLIEQRKFFNVRLISIIITRFNCCSISY